MQRNMVAYKYAKALHTSLSGGGFQEACEVYEILSLAFDNDRFCEVINSPFISKDKKLSLLTSLAFYGKDSKSSDKAMRLLEIVVKNGREALIPSIHSELKRLLELDKNAYMAVLYASSPVSQEALSDIHRILNEKLGVALDIKQEVDSKIDGIKIEVMDLGIEVSFYKSVFLQKLRDSIFKAL